MRRTFRSLTYPNYRVWFFGALVANIGTWMQRIAQDWLVLVDLTDNSGVAVGITTALQFLPFLILAPWAGVLADRLDLRRLLLVTQSISAGLAFVLGALVLSGRAHLWHVYACAFALGVVSAINGPARQVFVANLVPTQALPNAVALNSASFNGARLIGPASAGLIIAAVGTGWVFLINGTTFLAAIAALVAIRPGTFTPLERTVRKRGQVRAGLRYVRRRKDITVILVVVGVVSTFGLNFQLTSALMARVEFGLEAAEYGVIGSVLAIGSVGGALMAATRERVRVRLVVGAAFWFGVASLATALAPTYELYLAACVPLGFATLTMITSANATIQITTEPMMRGRVMAIYMMVFVGATPLGSPLVGWLGEEFGARWAIGLGAVAAIVVAVGAAVWSVRYWSLDVTYHVRRPLVRVHRLRRPTIAQTRRADARERLHGQEIEDTSHQP